MMLMAFKVHEVYFENIIVTSCSSNYPVNQTIDDISTTEAVTMATDVPVTSHADTNIKPAMLFIQRQLSHFFRRCCDELILTFPFSVMTLGFCLVLDR